MFILNYLKLITLLTALIGKGASFSWGKREENTFQSLKAKYCKAPVLSHWDPNMPIFLETDYSKFALRNALLQEKNRI